MNVRKLKAAIVESGKLRDDLAEGLGMSRSALRAKINGHREFSFKEAEALCQIVTRDRLGRREGQNFFCTLIPRCG